MQKRIGLFRKVMGVVVVGLMAGVLSVSAGSKPGTAIVKTISGTAWHLDSKGLERPLAVGAVLQEGDTVKTGVGARVFLLLPNNGPDIGLTSETTLRFARLAYEETELGPVMDTRLDLQQGGMMGHVNKLLAQSHYEVRTPKMLANVRGTEFWLDTLKTGQLHVISGVVTLTLFLDIYQVISDQPYTGPNPLTKVVTVNAGQSFFMPRGFIVDAGLTALQPVPLALPDQDILDFMQHFQNGNASSAVGERFKTKLVIDADTLRAKADVKFPPTVNYISP